MNLSTTSAYAAFVRLPLGLMIAALLFVGIFSKRGVLDWHRIRQQNESLSQKLADVQRARERTQRQVEALQSNREEQERVVRQILGYIKPTETVIEFP